MAWLSFTVVPNCETFAVLGFCHLFLVFKKLFKEGVDCLWTKDPILRRHLGVVATLGEALLLSGAYFNMSE